MWLFPFYLSILTTVSFCFFNQYFSCQFNIENSKINLGGNVQMFMPVRAVSECPWKPVQRPDRIQPGQFWLDWPLGIKSVAVSDPSPSHTVTSVQANSYEPKPNLRDPKWIHKTPNKTQLHKRLALVKNLHLWISNVHR